MCLCFTLVPIGVYGVVCCAVVVSLQLLDHRIMVFSRLVHDVLHGLVRVHTIAVSCRCEYGAEDAQIVGRRSDGSDFAASAWGVYQNAIEAKSELLCVQAYLLTAGSVCCFTAVFNMCAFFVHDCFGVE